MGGLPKTRQKPNSKDGDENMDNESKKPGQNMDRTELKLRAVGSFLPAALLERYVRLAGVETASAVVACLRLATASVVYKVGCDPELVKAIAIDRFVYLLGGLTDNMYAFEDFDSDVSVALESIYEQPFGLFGARQLLDSMDVKHDALPMWTEIEIPEEKPWGNGYPLVPADKIPKREPARSQYAEPTEAERIGSALLALYSKSDAITLTITDDSCVVVVSDGQELYAAKDSTIIGALADIVARMELL